MSDLDLVLPVVMSMLIGSVIGFERELASKPAGLRTHMLVAGASTLMVMLGDLIVSQFAEREIGGIIRADPIRIFEAILVGVSFLGSGTILRHKGEVEGLTTAASLLFVAGLGIAVALGRTTLALELTVVVLVVVRAARFLERRLLGRET